MLISGKVPPNWCTVAMPWSLASRGLLNSTGLPSISTVPDVGLWTPERILISVDLPAPLSPSRHSTSPRLTSSEMSCSTSIGPNDLLMPVSLSSGVCHGRAFAFGCGSVGQRHVAERVVHQHGERAAGCR